MVSEQIKGPLRSVANLTRRNFWRQRYWRLLNSLPERDLTAETAHGRLTFSSKDKFIGRSLYTAGHYGYSDLFDVVEILKAQGKLQSSNEGYLIDIGANVGTVCIPFVREQVFRRALAFEPEPHNFSYLKRNIDQNGLSDRVLPFQAAMSATNGEIEFELCPENHGDHRVRLSGAPAPQYNHFHEHDRSIIKVPVHTLDEMVASLDIASAEINLVWMDVQGHEGHIFQGAESLIAAGVPFVFEFWPYGLQSTGLDLDWFVDFVSSRFTHLWDLKSPNPDRMPASHIRELSEALVRSGDAVAQTDLVVF